MHNTATEQKVQFQEQYNPYVDNKTSYGEYLYVVTPSPISFYKTTAIPSHYESQINYMAPTLDINNYQLTKYDTLKMIEAIKNFPLPNEALRCLVKMFSE
jgi:hypothetical protein